MAQTPTRAANDAETPAKGRGAYLPVLPDGWEYTVRITGPDGTVEVSPPGWHADRDWHVEVRPKELDSRSLRRPDLAAAVRTAASSVKSLVKLSKHQAEVDAARKSLLDEIGGDTPGAATPADPPTPKPDPPKPDTPEQGNP